MTVSLPSNPSLRFLKEQAKDILKAHQVRDAACLEVLRRLNHIASASDAAIFAADMSLKEVQFALAMHYGFASWEDLRAHVLKEVTERVTKKCWETSAFRKGKEYVLDAEAIALNELAQKLGELPDWAVNVRDIMPKWGFELCAHRWLEGLTEAMEMIGTGKVWPTRLGRCGDVPGEVVAGAKVRAEAVEAWIAGKRDGEGLQAKVSKVMGQSTPEKIEAAQCFTELVRQFFAEGVTDQIKAELVQRWKVNAAGNALVEKMLQDDGLPMLLSCACGFRFLDILDIHIEQIGGDGSRAAESNSICGRQIRFILRDDPRRFTATRGYLWGMFAYLDGRDAAWIRANKPECADAAIHALHTVSQAGPVTPLRFWLVASLLKSAKTWVDSIATKKPNDTIPDYPKDLPGVPTMTNLCIA